MAQTPSGPGGSSGARVTRVGEGWLRRDAERISGALPPLLAEAERLAASVAPGVHGRRQAGSGETSSSKMSAAGRE